MYHLRLTLLLLLSCCALISMGQNTDVITAEQLPAKAGSYEPFNKTFTSGIEYYGKTAKEDNAIVLSYNTEAQPGIVTTKSNRKIKSIAVKWHGTSTSTGNREIIVYGDNYKYKDCSKLYDESGKNTLVVINEGDNAVKDLSAYPYTYIGLRSNGRVLVDNITISWAKILRNIGFDKEKYTATLGTDFVEPELKADIKADTPLRYSSSNTKVATVDEKTGEITLVSTGETTISVISEETEEYERETAQYTLTVSAKTVERTFAFADPTKFGYVMIGEKWDLDIMKGLTLPLNDVVITTTHGEKQNTRFYTDSQNCVGLRFYPGGSLTFTVPKGMSIISSKMEMTPAENDERNRVQKTTTPNSVTYSLPKDAPSSIYVGTATIQYTDAYTLNISEAGYATWCAQRAYILPQGLQGGIVTITNNIATVNYCVQPGDVVAPQTPLLIKGAPGVYTLIPTEKEGVTFTETENQLRPSITADIIEAPTNTELFIFSKRNNKLGFYWQKESTEGNSVRNIPNKAYLEVSNLSGHNSQGFRLGMDETTGIQSVVENEAAGSIYTLTGTRVQISKDQLPKGIYIINGKKVFIGR